jgi:hypothetical protein
MRRMSLALLVTASILAGFTCGHAVTVDLSAQFDIKTISAYAWRGVVIHDKTCLQPSVTLSTGDFSFNVWGTWDLEHQTNSSAHTRMDTTLEYTTQWRNLIISSGVIAYIYHDDSSRYNDDTFEIFTESILDVPLLPSIRLYYDFGEIGGLYSSFAVAHSFHLIKEVVALDLRADIGVADQEYSAARFSFPGDEAEGIEPFEPEETSLVDFTISAALPVALGEHAELAPGVKYMTLLDTDIKTAAEDAGEEVDQISYNLTLTIYF